MKEIVVLSSFERSVKKLAAGDRKKLTEALEKFNHFLSTGELGAGLGFKKINHDKYEFRIDIRQRVVFKQGSDTIYLVLVGDHNEVKKYLRNYRNEKL